MVELIDCAIHRIGHLSTAEKLILQGMALTPANFEHLDRRKLLSLGLGSSRNGRTFDSRRALEQAHNDIKWSGAPGCHILPIWHSLYPWLLRQLYNPPYLLFVRSSPSGPDPRSALKIFGLPAIAMVGTRRPSAAGDLWAYRLAEDLTASSLVIVSGLARGIDAAAHRGALRGGGLTVGVLGHGPDMVYPLSNSRLAAQIIMSGGCLVSEYPPGTQPMAFRFPERNRIISGLTAGLVMVEAPQKSGALISSDYALEQGREVIVLSQLLTSRRNDGGRMLKDCGAPVAGSAAEVIGYLSPDLLFPGEECRRV